MSANVSESEKRTRRDRAAMLVAEDIQSDTAIAEAVGVVQRTLERWKQQPDFQERVAYHRAAQAEAIKNEGIANRQNRVAALNDRWSRMQQVIDDRADYFASGPEADIPGGDTGLLVRTEKQIGGGDRAVHIVEHAVDTGLLRELRAHEEQAAKELGQWEDKTRVQGDILVREYVGVDPGDV